MYSEIQKIIGKSRLATRAAIKIRNQCKAIISYHIGKENNGAENGEFWFLNEYLPFDTSCVIDVGANRGRWTEAVCQATPNEVEVHCYEPDHRAATKLRENASLPDRVQLHEMAVGRREGEIQLFMNEESTELTTAVPPSSGQCYTPSTVELTTLDRELNRLGISCVDLLKIDVEGYEEDVLRGGSSALSDGAISCIQFEYGGNWRHAGSTLQGVVNYLEGYDFQVLLVRPDCLRKVRLEELGEYFSYSNYVAVHDRIIDKISSLVHPKSFP